MHKSSLILLALALTPAASTAQQNDTSLIPRRLATALIGANEFGPRDPRIVVGTLADSRIANVVPRGALVLGGITSSSRYGPPSSTSLFVLAGISTDSAIALMDQQFIRAGWKETPESPWAGEGFAMDVSRGSRSGFGKCGPSASAWVSASREGANDALVQVRSTQTWENTACDTTRGPWQMSRERESIKLPTLRLPPGTSGGSTGSGGGGEAREAHARLGSSLGAAEMLAHFAPQLQEQGWTLKDRTTSGDLAMLSATKPGEGGAPLHLQLGVHRYSPRQHITTLRVWRDGWP